MAHDIFAFHSVERIWPNVSCIFGAFFTEVNVDTRSEQGLELIGFIIYSTHDDIYCIPQLICPVFDRSFH